MTPSSKATGGSNEVLVDICITRHDRGFSYCLLCCFLLPFAFFSLVMRTLHIRLQ